MKKFLFFILLLPSIMFAHGGGLDSNGGHTNKKTGEYHCHKSPCASSETIDKTTKYNRKEWVHWVDGDGDCQNTRAEILIASSIEPVNFKTAKSCRVTGGEWVGEYTGTIFTDASTLDIDHIVPLKEAHDSGGAKWSREKKKQFANDPMNLIAVSASENRQKGSKDIASWLPDDSTYHCEYVAQWVAVKEKYSLNIDNEEQEAIDSVLVNCN